MASMGQGAMRHLRRALFDHVQRLPMRFFDRYPVGRLVTRLTNDVENLSEMFTAGAVALVADLFLMVFFAAALFWIHPRLAAVSMLVVPVLAVAALIFRYKVRQAFREVRVKIARINAHLNETISGMKVVQLFAREARNFRDFERQNASHRDSWFRSIRYDALLFSSTDLATNLTMALILWYGAALIGAGRADLGLLFLFVDWMRRFFRPLMDLSAKYSIMQSSMSSCERIFQLLDIAAEVPDRSGAVSGPVRGEVTFENVTFAYAEEPVLRDVSFRVAPGERVALVGHTGAGKTTVLKLLARLYELQEGSIRVDGVDIRDLPRAELRRHISFVLQDVFLFNADLRYNVALGREDLSDADLDLAARTTHADRLVGRLPSGWSQEVGERGVNFSTGEATANVDTETEALIQDALHQLMEGKTSIVVAHRLSTIQDVDRIYVMHHGEMRESGTHEELLAARGLYWRLYQLQYAAQEQSAA
jgi:ABC-type multidrug transport system fused ATPase/permease subunit